MSKNKNIMYVRLNIFSNVIKTYMQKAQSLQLIRKNRNLKYNSYFFKMKLFL